MSDHTTGIAVQDFPVRYACFPYSLEQPRGKTGGYEHLYRQSVAVAGETIQRHSLALDAWHTAMSLILQSVSGTPVFEGSQDVQASKSLRLGFAVGATHSSKVAMDTCLGGQYTQSMMMCRYLLESWIRIAYLEIQPSAARNWFQQENAVPQPAKNSTMLSQLKERTEYKTNATIASQLLSEADNYAHPSPRTIAHAYRLGREHNTLGTVYIPDMVGLTIHIAATSCVLIAGELPHFVIVQDTYAETFEQIDQQMQAWDQAQLVAYEEM